MEGRIMAIDYGKKRTGLAVTDPLQIIATRLTTISTTGIWDFLDRYFKQEEVVLVLIGYPLQVNNQPSQAVTWINPFIKTFVRRYPDMPLQQVDERFTSKLAFQAMIDSGLKKSDRQDKELVDGVSATILLQSWLEQKKYHK